MCDRRDWFEPAADVPEPFICSLYLSVAVSLYVLVLLLRDELAGLCPLFRVLRARGGGAISEAVGCGAVPLLEETEAARLARVVICCNICWSDSGFRSEVGAGGADAGGSGGGGGGSDEKVLDEGSVAEETPAVGTAAGGTVEIASCSELDGFR